jgi:hypothetical protein
VRQYCDILKYARFQYGVIRPSRSITNCCENRHNNKNRFSGTMTIAKFVGKIVRHLFLNMRFVYIIYFTVIIVMGFEKIILIARIAIRIFFSGFFIGEKE